LSELKAIDAESGHQRKLWLTGHSQGGSVLQILAMRLLDKGYRAQGIVTFGSPKPGPDRFRVAYDSSYAGVTHRWINKFDIVPSMPLRDSWDHVGRQHFIDHDRDSITFDDNEVREYSRPVRGFLNHGIAEYIKNIGKSRP
jgi:pimeloyl-ACP methyl ester carboxylesterase